MSADIKVRPVSTFEWIRAISSIDFGASDSVKGVAGRTIKGVAFRLSYWANADGTQLLAGPARIAVVCEVDYKTAKTVLSVLRKHGLISVVRRGRGPVSDGGIRVGDEYRLTLPLDLDDRLRVRSAEEIDAAIDAMKDANRRKVTGNSRPRKSDGLQGSATPVTQPEDSEVTGEMVPGVAGLRGNPGASYGVNGSAVPTQHLPNKNHLPISLFGEHLTEPAPNTPGTKDRERDGTNSSTRSQAQSQLDAFAHEVLATEGIDPDEAAQILSVINRERAPRTCGWWRTVSGNRDIVQIIAAARVVLDENCPNCKGTTQIITGYEQSGAPIIDRCPECTVDPNELPYHLTPRFPADINQQARSSQRLSPAARKATAAFTLADQLDARFGVTRPQHSHRLVNSHANQDRYDEDI